MVKHPSGNILQVHILSTNPGPAALFPLDTSSFLTQEHRWGRRLNLPLGCAASTIWKVGMMMFSITNLSLPPHKQEESFQMDTQYRTWAWRAIPVVVDLAAIILYRSLAPRLTARFQQKSMINVAIIGGVYLLFCLSVFFIRKLEGEADNAYLESTSALAFFGITFGFFLSFVIADVSGVLDNLDSLGTNMDSAGANIGLLVGSVVWLALVFLYPAVLLVKIEPSISRESSQFFLVEFLTMVGINLMVIVTMAHWDAYFADTEPYEGLGMGAKVLIFVPTFAFFLLFYGPPRLVFLAKNTHTLGFATGMLQLSYFVWNSLSQTAWI
jgi:hypothetical protein